MQSLYTFTTPPDSCGYLPRERWELQYEIVTQLTEVEYQERLEQGWRRFGHALFRPVCARCQKCQSIRIPTTSFEPDRSQRRAAKLNADSVTLTINAPHATREKISLYDRFHHFHQHFKDWPEHAPDNVGNYIESFVHNPFETQEWTYRLGEQLLGVGYVDRLPDALSAIYFFYDPDERKRSLGVWNVLSILQKAREWGVPYVYLGYFVEGCRSLEYKAGYRPNEVLGPNGVWRTFR